MLQELLFEIEPIDQSANLDPTKYFLFLESIATPSEEMKFHCAATAMPCLPGLLIKRVLPRGLPRFCSKCTHDNFAVSSS